MAADLKVPYVYEEFWVPTLLEKEESGAWSGYVEVSKEFVDRWRAAHKEWHRVMDELETKVYEARRGR